MNHRVGALVGLAAVLCTASGGVQAEEPGAIAGLAYGVPDPFELLPLGRSSRTHEQSLALRPGVQRDPFGFAWDGGSSLESGYRIDGLLVNDPGVGAQSTRLVPEFFDGGLRVDQAEDRGRFTGGSTSATLHTGGNAFHGAVFANWLPLELARTQFAQSSAIAGQTRQRYTLDFGGTLSGPIVKDRLFFFVGFAPQVSSLGLDRIIQRRVDDGTGRPVIDPATNAPKEIEVARQSYVNTTSAYQYAGTLTWAVDDANALQLSVFGNPTFSTGAQRVGAFNEGAMIYDVQSGATDAALRYTTRLQDRSLVLEAAAGWHHQLGGALTGSASVQDVGGLTAARLADTPAVRYTASVNIFSGFLDDGLVPASQRGDDVRAACSLAANGFNPCPVSGYQTGGVGYLERSKLDRYSAALEARKSFELAGRQVLRAGVDWMQDTVEHTQTYSGDQFINAVPNGFLTNPVDSYHAVGFGIADLLHPGRPLFLSPSSDGVMRLAGTTFQTRSKNISLALHASDTWIVLDKVMVDAGLRVEVQRLYRDPNAPDANSALPAGPDVSLVSLLPHLGVGYELTQLGHSHLSASYRRRAEYVPLAMADTAFSAATSVGYSANPAACVNPKDPRTCAVTGFSVRGGYDATAVAPDLGGQYIDEYQAGFFYQLPRDLSARLDGLHQTTGRVIEDLSTDGGNSYLLGNPGAACSQESIKAGTCALQYAPDGTQPVPAPRRGYDAATLSLRKEHSDGWFAEASYTLSRSQGSYVGLYNPTTGQVSPNTLSEYDSYLHTVNRDGPLPGDVPSSFKLDGAWVHPVTAKAKVTLGAVFRADQGTPLSYLGALPVYGAGESFILPRGAAGRLPWTWELDLRAAASYQLASDYTLAVSADLFNVTDNQTQTAADQNYTFDAVAPLINGAKSDLVYLKSSAGAPVTVNPQFLRPTAWQLPFAARFGARLSF